MVALSTVSAQQQAINLDSLLADFPHKDRYTSSLNPIKPNYKLMNECVSEIINHVRKSVFALPLQSNVPLDSAAKFQSDYQALKNEKTEFNLSPYKTTEQRLIKYGATRYAEELIAKGRTERGNDNSFFFVASELLRPLLSNPKTFSIVVSKSWKYTGIGTSIDPETGKSIYLSLILGNDKSLDYIPIQEKNAPYTKAANGLKPYSYADCKKCENQQIYDVFMDYIKYGLGESEVRLVSDNSKIIERLLAGKDDALVLDFVAKDQYDCSDKNRIDNNRPNRGFMSKQITLEDILKNNTANEKGKKALDAVIATVPVEVAGGDFEVYAIIVKENIPCRVAFPVRLDIQNAHFERSVTPDLAPDFSTYPPVGSFVPNAEQAQLEFIIPFDKAQSEYKKSDIEPFIKNLKEPAFEVNKLTITAYTSFDGDNVFNDFLQKKRAESIVNAFKSRQTKDIEYNIVYDNGWDLFKRDVAQTEFANLTKMSMEAAKKQLTDKAMTTLEPILAKHRFAKINMQVNYETTEEHQVAFVAHKFNTALAAKNYPLATAVQKYILEKIQADVYGKNIITLLEIAPTKENVPFLINRLCMEFAVSGKLSSEMKKSLEDWTLLDAQNQILKYNLLIAELNASTDRSQDFTTSKLAQLEGFKSSGKIPLSKIEQTEFILQMDLFEVARKANAAENTTQPIYEKLKTLTHITPVSWQQAYNLAAFFAHSKDFPAALQLMDPFLQTPGISNDFIFAYLTLSAYRENAFLSHNFSIAVKLAAEKDKVRFCKTMNKLPYAVLENAEAKKIYCKSCK